MGRPRKPAALQELTGAYKKNPQRRRVEPVPTGPLGDPPERLSKEEKSAWHELVAIAPPGVLKNADRMVVELASRLLARVWKEGIGGRSGLAPGELSMLEKLLSKMGMSPADRSKVDFTKDGSPDRPQKQTGAGFEEFAPAKSSSRVN